MARITDENKMKTIKQALLDIIVRDGSSHASIAKMAKKAGVSSGYLYRHYDSKESLIEDLYKEKFELINSILLNSIEESKTLDKFISVFQTKLVHLTQANENEVLFILKMMTDYSIKLSDEMKQQLSQAVLLFKTTYQQELNSTITSEQIFTQILGSILLFINMRKRALFKADAISDNEINSFSQMILKTLQ